MPYYCTIKVLYLLTKSTIFLLAMLAAVIGYSQDPVFSQFYAAPIQLNPALTGTVEGGLISLNYRNQWPSINKAYQTYAVSGSKYFKQINSGFGISILSDDAGNGLYKTSHIDFSYSYRIQVKYEHFIQGAIQVGYGHSRIDWDELVFFDQIDPEFGAISPGGTPFPTSEVRPVSDNSNYVDIGTGVLYFGPTFYIGASFLHLNTPNDNFLETQINSDDLQGLPLRWSVHGGTQIDIGSVGKKRKSTTYLASHFLFVKQKDYYHLNAGANLRINAFGLGLSYRHSGSNPDAVIASTSIQAGPYRIGYSYDVTISSLAVPSGGAHELSLSINFEKFGWYKEESRYNDCLNLFR